MNNRDDDDDEIIRLGDEEAMSNSEWSIDVGMSSVNSDLVERAWDHEDKDWKKQSIYEMYWFNKHSSSKVEVYEPLIVSIGPYHHGRPQLRAMEVHKRRAVRHFIKRSNKSIEFYMKEMASVENEVREAYEHLDDNKWGRHHSSNQSFLQMIITDGCFILEFMEILSGAPKDYAQNDPVFSYYGCIAHYNVVMRDLLLLENQLPYLVLKKLLVIADKTPELSEENAEAILSQMMMFTRDAGPAGAHMLDMYMRGMFKAGYSRDITTDGQVDHQENNNNNNNNNGGSSQARPTATQLSEAGFTFKIAHSFDEISFEEQTRTVYLPQLNINEYTISTFMNLKMFELRGTTDRHFNSYISLMHALMKSASDVRVLKSEGIIVNLLGREEEVLRLMKQLAEDTVVDTKCPSFVAQGQMYGFYKDSMRKWENELRMQVHEWLSNLHQTYFRTPWSTISVLAAAVLLLLTVIQAVYSIKSYVSK